MAGNGSRGGSSRSAGGVTARGKSRAGAPTADQKAMQDSMNRIQRYRNYMLSSKGGRLTPDDPVIFEANRRLATKQNKALAQGGMRINVRSKAAAGARYRIQRDNRLAEVQSTRRGYYNDQTTMGTRPGLVGRRSGTTRGQGNLLTGGFSDVVRGRRMNISTTFNTGRDRAQARDRRARGRLM